MASEMERVARWAFDEVEGLSDIEMRALILACFVRLGGGSALPQIATFTETTLTEDGRAGVEGFEQVFEDRRGAD